MLSQGLSAATYVSKSISGAAAVELFQFTTVAGVQPANTMVVAKFVMDDNLTNVVFQVAPVGPSSLSSQDFAVCLPVTIPACGGDATLQGLIGTKTLEDTDLSMDVFDLRARDQTNAGAPAELAAGGHRIIKLSVKADATYVFPALTWSVKAFPIAAGTDVYSGFWEKGAGADAATVENTLTGNVTLAKLEADPDPLEFGDVQTSLSLDQTPILEYTLKNVGTTTLTLAGSINPPAASPFSISGAVVISPLKPMESLAIPITFRPVALGLSQTVVNIASNDPDSPFNHTLRGTGITLDAVLLMDVSGSMNRSATTGVDGVAELETRLWKAKEAGLQLYQAYNELTGGQARIGIYTFPDAASPSPDIATAAKPVPINSASLVLGPVTNSLGRSPPIGLGLIADNWTPMAKGIEISQADLQTDAGKRPTILLLSDGAHNTPTANPQEVLDWVAPLQTKGIRVHTVAYGATDQAQVDHDTLNSLATGTGGVPLAANPSDYAALKKAFRDAVREWLGLRSDADPAGSILGNQQKQHDVCLDDTAYTATFVVDWKNEQDDAIAFELETPSGERLTPATAGVGYYESKSYAMYVVKGDRVRGGAGAGRWRLHLTGSPDLGSVPLDYFYSVMTQGPFRLEPRFDRSVYSAGEDLRLELEIPESYRRRLSNPTLSVDYDAPAASFGSFAATAQVQPEWVFVSDPPILATAAGGSQTGQRLPEPQSILQRKMVALKEYADITYADQRINQTLELVDNGQGGDRVAGDGIYTALVSRLSHDGLHRFRIKAFEDLRHLNNGCLSIDTQMSRYVPINFADAVTPTNVGWESLRPSLFFDPNLYDSLVAEIPRDVQSTVVAFRPEDAQGNLLGLGNAARIRLDVTNGEAFGPIIDNWNGVYYRVVLFEAGATPSVTVSIGDVSSGPITPPGQGGWSLSLHAGNNDPQDSFLDGDLSYGLDLEYLFNDRFGLELFLGFDEFKVAGGGSVGDVTHLSLNAKLYLLPGANRLVLIGGIGTYDPSQGSSENGFNLGIGGQFNLWPKTALEVTGKYHTVSGADSDFEFITWHGGVRFRF